MPHPTLSWICKCIPVMMLSLLAACTTTIPTYPQAPAETVLQTIATNLAKIKTISGPARLTLISAEGDSISLTAAIAVKAPDSLRLRAWKFDRAVFDATIVGPDVWLVPMDAPDTGAADLSQISSEQIAHSISLLSGMYFTNAKVISQTQDSMDVIGTSSGFESIKCEIDLATRTPELFTFGQVLSDSAPLNVLRMGDFRTLSLDGGDTLTWPARLTFERGDASITIYLDQIQVNQSLPDNAFRPPVRAVKQP